MNKIMKRNLGIMTMFVLASILLFFSNSSLLSIGDSPTTYSSKISAGSDDSYERNGQMVNKQTIDMGKSWNSVYRGAYRFKLDVPQGANVSSAVLSLAYNWRSGSKASVIIYGENKGNSNAFSTNQNDISSRVKTANKVNWDNLASASFSSLVASTP